MLSSIEIIMTESISQTKKELRDKVASMHKGTFGRDHLMAGFFLSDGRECEFITKWAPNWGSAKEWIEKAGWRDIEIPTTREMLEDFALRVLS